MQDDAAVAEYAIELTNEVLLDDFDLAIAL